VRKAIRKEFATLSYLPEEEKKALGEICPVCGGKL